MVDSHCHLTLLKEEDLEESLKDSRFDFFVSVSFDQKTIRENLELSKKEEKVYCSLGFHPHEASKVKEEDLLKLKELAKENEKVVAVGECGLDFYKNYSPKKVQEEVFRKQINLARELGLPLIIHMRNSEREVIEILKEERAYEVGGVLHCFTGDYETMKRALDLNFYISYSGIITFKNASSLREVVKKTPTSRVLLETDAPWLSPEPVRGRPNKPTNIFYTARVLAELYPNTSLEDVDRMVSQNARNLFGLSKKKGNTIVYEINGRLYINLTNKCNLHCLFCQREREREFWVKGHWVWTDRDPSVEEIIRKIGEPKRYKEVVFCGYGEPTLRFSALKEVAKWVKERGGRVRVDTNGLMFSFLKREKLKELVGLVDVFSVSLNAGDKETYNRVMRPFQRDAFNLVLEFIKEAKRLNFKVVVSAVNYEGVDVEKVKKICKDLGVEFKLREFEVVG